MTRLLQEAFDVVAPALGDALVAPSVRRRLRSGLGALAPILQVGLEVRLAAGAAQVDVQQAVLAHQEHHHVLAQYADRMSGTAGSTLAPAWQRIAALAHAWADGTDFDWLQEIWLEYDVTRPLSADTVPSVFLNVPTDRPVSERRAAVERATALLRGRPLPTALRAHLAACFEAVPEGAGVSHVGLMLARAVDALRVNVKGLTPGEVDGFVRRLGGDPGQAGAHAAWLLRHAHHVTVCLDIGERVGPRVGLEAFFRGQPGEDAGWAGLLHDLVDQAVCTADKRAALLAWSGISVPPRVAAPWPGELMARALLEPKRLSAIARRLNHVKVTHQPGQPLEAKAYLGFGHLWAGDEAPPEPPA